MQRQQKKMPACGKLRISVFHFFTRCYWITTSTLERWSTKIRDAVNLGGGQPGLRGGERNSNPVGGVEKGSGPILIFLKFSSQEVKGVRSESD